MEQRSLYYNKKFLYYFFIGLTILLIVGGWYYYTHKFKSLEKTSMISQNFFKKNDSIVTHTTAEAFRNYKNISGTLISLKQAKIDVEQKHFSEAELELKKGLQNLSNVNLQVIFKLRLARLQLQQHKIDDALYVLKSIKGITWRDIVADLQGDAWFRKGNFLQAYKFWCNGIALTTSPILKQLMKFKMKKLPESVKTSFTSCKIFS
ncbi:MAG: tetratricopeptide repeat protein [Candidatus Dasytiphilus stammeri]